MKDAKMHHGERKGSDLHPRSPNNLFLITMRFQGISRARKDIPRKLPSWPYYIHVAWAICIKIPSADPSG